MFAIVMFPLFEIHIEDGDTTCEYKEVQVSVYCARRIPAHLRCTQCSILLHLIDICFLPCMCARYRKSRLV